MSALLGYKVQESYKVQVSFGGTFEVSGTGHKILRASMPALYSTTCTF